MLSALHVLLLFASPVSDPAAAPSPDPRSLDIPVAVRWRAAALVRELGSPVFDDRERAARDLAALGRLALPALRYGVERSPDAEVRLRCGLLLPRAREADHVARVAVFVADRDGKFEHDVAGWGLFRKAVGDGPDARRLFERIAGAASTRRVLIATRWPGPSLNALAAERWTRLGKEARPVQAEGVQAAARPVSLLDVAALLLADIASPEADEGLGSGWVPTVLLIEDVALAETARGRGPDGPVFRRLVTAWLDGKSGAVGLQHAIQIATAIQLPPAVAARYHARTLDQKGIDAHTKLVAVGALARSGDRGHLAALDRLRDDTDAVDVGWPDGTMFTSPVADLALAAMIHLSGQKLTDYGFTIAPGGPVDFTRVDPCRFAPDRTATADQKRERAAAKWEEWVKKNPTK
jgi:hypothetical protein